MESSLGECVHQLTRIDYMPRDFYEPLKIKMSLVIGFVVIHCSVCAAAVVFVFVSGATRTAVSN